MHSFAKVKSIAAKRKNGTGALERLLSLPKSAAELRANPDHRFLAEMTRAVFQAGLDWSLIDNKWPGFEAAFEGFAVERWYLMSVDDVDRLSGDKRILRNVAKIRSVGVNAQLLRRLAESHGPAGAQVVLQH